MAYKGFSFILEKWSVSFNADQNGPLESKCFCRRKRKQLLESFGIDYVGTDVGRWVDVDGVSIWKFFSNSSTSLVKQEAELSAESENWRGGVRSLKRWKKFGVAV